MKLHLGCGKDYKIGYINCDFSTKYKIDMKVNLEKPLPFEDNSVEEIITNHTVEHIRNFVPLMEEIYRVCKHRARIKINVPYFAYPGAYQDPTHVRFFTLKTFNYFDKSSEYNYFSICNFRIVKKRLTFMSTRPKISKLFDWFINGVPNFYERFLSRIIPADNLYVELEVVK